LSSVGRDHQVTRVLTDTKEIVERTIEFFNNAKVSIDLFAESGRPQDVDAPEFKRIVQAVSNLTKRGGRVRLLTRIDGSNMVYVKELLSSSLVSEVRNVHDLKGNFAISDAGEYISAPAGEDAHLPTVIIYSTSNPLIERHRNLFEKLWKGAMPALQRVRELEEGVQEPTIDVIRHLEEIRALSLRLVQQAKEEILLTLPSAHEFHRKERFGLIDSMMEAARRGVKVSILSPIDEVIRKAYPENIHGPSVLVPGSFAEKGLVSIRSIQSSRPGEGVTVLVTDRTSSLVIEEIELSEGESARGSGIAVYSTTAPAVKASIEFFERASEGIDLLLKEKAALERERSNLNQIQLLQDILTHDIRNYVQISKGSAELLREQQNIVSPLLDSIERAADNTGDLVEKTKRLARIMTQSIQLRPVDLRSSIEKSVRLITEANRDKKVLVTYSPPDLHANPGAEVLADELLDEAFINILSNSVRFTDGDEVPIEIELKETGNDAGALESGGQEEGGKSSGFWKVSITDRGEGIHDDRKSKVFTRYQNTATGSGLGLSIVYALVVGRYGGKVRIVDRIPGEYAKGTRLEVWLRRGEGA
jgi:signal transduction histidine kinase